MDKRLEQFEDLLGQEVDKDVALAKYTSYKIGGPAKYFFIAQNNEDLVRAVVFAKKCKIPACVLGGASNVLISDYGFNGLVIINKAKDIIFKSDNRVVADAGVILMVLVNQTIKKGLVGLEWAAGIPGTVGGAVRGNAGAFRSETADNLIGVEIMRGSKQFILSKEQCQFGYRDSIFKHNNDLIISAEFQLTPGDSAKAKARLLEILAKRRAGQPLQYGSAGSVFKNVLINADNQNLADEIKDLPQEYREFKKIPAAWLIEQCGLKGKQIGQAQISDMHANFIINLKGATAKDVKALIEEIKAEVKAKFGFKMEEEIQYLGSK